MFQKKRADYEARLILSKLSTLTPNYTTYSHVSQILFGSDRDPKRHFKYTDLSTLFPGYTFSPSRNPKSLYQGENPSEGGYVYARPGLYKNVTVLDIASMHPTSLVELNLFGKYTKKFKTN